MLTTDRERYTSNATPSWVYFTGAGLGIGLVLVNLALLVGMVV